MPGRLLSEYKLRIVSKEASEEGRKTKTDVCEEGKESIRINGGKKESQN